MKYIFYILNFPLSVLFSQFIASEKCFLQQLLSIGVGLLWELVSSTSLLKKLVLRKKYMKLIKPLFYTSFN